MYARNRQINLFVAAVLIVIVTYYLARGMRHFATLHDTHMQNVSKTIEQLDDIIGFSLRLVSRSERLAARTALSDRKYQELTHKGQQYDELLTLGILEDSADSGASTSKLQLGQVYQSQFSSYDAFQENGWVKNVQPFGNTLDHISDALGDLKLSTTDKSGKQAEGDNTFVTWEQSQADFNGKAQKPTGARYANIYNPRQGVIIQKSNNGPRDLLSVREGRMGEWLPIPSMSHLSDTLYLEYQHLAQEGGHPLENLRYVIVDRTHTPDTIDLIDTIMRKTGKGRGVDEEPSPDTESLEMNYPEFLAPSWQQRVILSATQESDAFHAMLATTNGATIAWLLLQHREAD